MNDFSEFDVDQEYEKRINEIFAEFDDFRPGSDEELEIRAKEYEIALRKAGMPEDEIEEQVEGYKEIHWTPKDWARYYGYPEDLEEAMDCDDRD